MTERRVGAGWGSLPILQIRVSFLKRCHAPGGQFSDVSKCTAPYQYPSQGSGTAHFPWLVGFVPRP